jgi:hypothetical protein
MENTDVCYIFRSIGLNLFHSQIYRAVNYNLVDIFVACEFLVGCQLFVLFAVKNYSAVGTN